MGKKKKSTTDPSKYAKPYITPAANALQAAGTSYQPTAQANSALVGGLVPGLVDKVKNGNPALNPALAYNNDVLGGKYLSGNPQLEGMVDLARSNTTDAVGARFGALGGYGGTKYAQSLGKGLADSELALRYENYGDERDRMGSAAGLAPALAGAGNIDLEALLAALGAQQDLALGPASQYAAGVGGLLGGYTTNTQKQGLGSSLGGLAGAALSGWASGGFRGV